MRKTFTALFSIVMLAGAAGAQLVHKQALGLDAARRAITAAQGEAKRLNAPGGVIAIVDDGGNLVALERLDGTFAAGANISIGKARTAALFKRPTKAFEDIIKNGRTSMVALNDFTPLQGGVPIVVDGQVVGAVGVSGAASAQQDEELALAAAGALSAPAASSAMPARDVRYFDVCEVDMSFDKGAVLFDGAGANYMVHTSRRTEAGKAEVHARETDIIHVIDGTAVFVTGGTVVGGAGTAPDEVRGASIAGGQEFTLAKGDVIVVPAGTPHWFKQIKKAPFLYYVVKVR